MASPYFTLVVEDRAHDLFAYRLLLHWGVRRQRIYVVPYPKGAGSGEQHVRKKFPTYLAALRAAHSHRFLVAVTDADNQLVSDRRAQIMTQLDACGIVRPSLLDDVVILIPKRTVEAWLHYLESDLCDEAGRLDALFAGRIDSACRDAPPILDAWLDMDEAMGPPSLLLGRADLLRIRGAARS